MMWRMFGFGGRSALDTSRRQPVMRPYSFNRGSGDIRRPIEGIWPPAMPAGQGAVGVMDAFDLNLSPTTGMSCMAAAAASSACARRTPGGDLAGRTAGDHLRSASAEARCRSRWRGDPAPPLIERKYRVCA